MSFDITGTPVAHWPMFGGDGAGWHHMGYGWFGGGMHPFGGIFMLLLVFLFVYALMALVRRYTGERPRSAVEILKARFARGEIGREEFEETLKTVR